MKTIPMMLVFDIDGVLTNPHTMEFNKTSLERIAAELAEGVPVALNTGRATSWVFERVLPKLQEKVSLEEMAHLLLVAEKGGVRVEFRGQKPDVVEDTSIALPKAFMQQAPSLLDKAADENSLLRQYMFWDDGKRTMASFEKLPEVSIEEFERVRGKLYAGIEKMLEKFGLKEFHIDESIIATDVEHQRAGKRKGANQIITWLAGRDEEIEHFYSFGDSPSDEAMAVAFADAAQSTFVYVGIKRLADDPNPGHERVVMNGGFDTDAAAYLERL